MNQQLYINFFIAGNSFTILLFGVGQLFVQKKTTLHYRVAAVMIVGSINLLVDTAFRTGLLFNVPHLLYISYPLEYLLGPLFYLFLMGLVFGNPPVKRWERMLFFPAIVVFVFLLPYYLQPASDKRAHIPLYIEQDGFLGSAYWLIDRGIEIWLFICLGFFLFKAVPVLSGKTKRIRQHIDLIIAYSIIIIIWTVCFALVVFFDLEQFYSVTILCGSFLALLFFFFYMRDPLYFLKIKTHIEQEEAGEYNAVENAQTILKKLEELMEKQKLYLDENLSLSSLASSLDIQAYQLSRILNGHLHTGFKNYINAFRIENAKAILIDEFESSILDIAFRSGFRSKSNFNSLFKQHTGMTPKVYRARMKSGD